MHLALRSAQHRRQPPTLAGIHEQEHHIVLIEQFLKFRNVVLGLLEAGGWYRVSRHRNAETVSSRVLSNIMSVKERARRRRDLLLRGRSSSNSQLRTLPLASLR